MTPKIEQMTNQELIKYALTHRDNKEPLRVLYSRRTPDEEATWYGPMITSEGQPIEENVQIAQEAIHQRIEATKQKKESKKDI